MRDTTCLINEGYDERFIDKQINVLLTTASFLSPLFSFLNFFTAANDYITRNDLQQPKYLQELTEPTVIEQLAYILIAAGAFIFIISFLGYCGAIKESRVLLTAYGLFIIIIILLQVALIVVAAIYKAEAETHSKKFLQHTITEHYTHKSQRNAVTLLWDFAMSEVILFNTLSILIFALLKLMQVYYNIKLFFMIILQLHCCGVEGVSDFEVGKAQEFHKYAKVYADKNGLSKQAIPEACCKLKPRNQTSREQGLFIPVDEDCITVPTTYNSNMNKVIISNWS